jgi:hypothetical protein
MGFRFYYDKDFDFIFQEQMKFIKPTSKSGIYIATKIAKARMRMYANLFCRDMRKELINEFSVCKNCYSNDHLQLDHIISIYKGGINHISNIQILCRRCNRQKSDK